MVLLAHAGHWSTALIYLAPMALVAAWVARDNLRRRRQDRAGEAGEER